MDAKERASGTKGQSQAIAYVRQASGDRGLRADQQRDAIERWARAHKVQVVQWHTDEGPADNVTLDDRIGLMNALLALRTRVGTMLIVTSRDRLAKDSIALAMIERLVSREEARIVYVRDKDEPSEAEAKLKKKLVAAFSEYERALMRVRTRAAVAIKRSRGEMTGRCPWGYHLAADGKTLERDEREQNILAVVRHMRASGRKIREIVGALREMGVVGRNGKPIGPTRVFEMIQGGRKKATEGETLPERV
jgi:DNA invertase Pin-like site-specific DNA recombinase